MTPKTRGLLKQTARTSSDDHVPARRRLTHSDRLCGAPQAPQSRRAGGGVSAVPGPSLSRPAAAPRGPLSLHGLGSYSRPSRRQPAAHLSWGCCRHSRQGGGGAEGTNESPNSSRCESPASPSNAPSRRPRPGNLCPNSDPSLCHTHTHRGKGGPTSEARGSGDSEQGRQGIWGALGRKVVPRGLAREGAAAPQSRGRAQTQRRDRRDPPAASGPPPRAPRNGTAAARTRTGWFWPLPPPGTGGSRLRVGCHSPPARAADPAPGAAGRRRHRRAAAARRGLLRPVPSAPPPGRPPRDDSCPAESPGSKSSSAWPGLQAQAPASAPRRQECALPAPPRPLSRHRAGRG